MNSQDLSLLLEQNMKARAWGIVDLATASGVVYETARRAVRGEYGISLESTNRLLVAINHKLSATPTLEQPTPLEETA